MNLIHRNRVGFSRLDASNTLRCGPPSPAGKALSCVSAFFGYSFRGSHFEPSLRGKGDRSGANFTEVRGEMGEAIAVDEVHHTDALLHHVNASCECC